METRNQTHPTSRQLAAFALNRLAPEARARLERHVGDCTSCSQFLAETPRDVLVTLFKDALGAMSQADQSTPGVRDAATYSDAVRAAEPQRPDSPAPGPKTPGQDVAKSSASFAGASPSPLALDELPEALRAQSKYRVQRLLGRGGMGSVYEAYHERMDRVVAIKIINSSLVDHPEALLRFDQEVKAAAKLDHANVARAYDADEFGSVRLLVMEFVPGQSLDQF